MRWRTAVLLTAISLGQPLSAALSWEPPCCGAAELHVEGLVFRASTCSLPFVLLDPRTFAELGGRESEQAILTTQEEAFPQGQVQSMRPNYAGGVRLAFGYIFNCGGDIIVIGTQFRSTQAKRFVPGTGGIWEVFAHPNNVGLVLYDPLNTALLEDQLSAEAVAKLNVRYYSLDTQIGARGFFWCYLWWRAVFGFHYISLHHSFSTDYQGTELPGVDDEQENLFATNVELCSRRSVSLWGVGPCVGIDASYDLGLGLGFGGRVHLGGVMAPLRHRRFESLVRSQLGMDEPVVVLDEVLDVSTQTMTQVSPFIDARLGFNFTLGCYPCMALTVEFGYEFLCYYSLLRQTVYTGDRATSRDLCPAFCLDGFYLHVLFEL